MSHDAKNKRMLSVRARSRFLFFFFWRTSHKDVSVQRVYRAMYDYEAQDVDEVSFCDGDLIVNCTAVDEGWMTGLVQRTGRHGMLPANYVEPAQI